MNIVILIIMIMTCHNDKTTVVGQIIATLGWKIRRNYAKIARKKRDTPDAQNWPRREAPRPILCAACVVFFVCKLKTFSMYFLTKSCNHLSLYRMFANFSRSIWNGKTSIEISQGRSRILKPRSICVISRYCLRLFAFLFVKNANFFFVSLGVLGG